MPTALFFKLDNAKKRTIIDEGIKEFALYGYDNSSTNRIVRNCGISKGSLFKYFPSKEEFYFYLLDHVTAELMSDIEKAAENLPDELFNAVIHYAEAEFAWYIRHPEKYRMILHAFTKDDSEIYRKTSVRYGPAEQNIYYRLMEKTDAAQLSSDKQKIIHILLWFLKGFNEDFMLKIHAGEFGSTEPDSIKDKYMKSLYDHMDILKKGLKKQRSDK